MSKESKNNSFKDKEASGWEEGEFIVSEVNNQELIIERENYGKHRKERGS